MHNASESVKPGEETGIFSPFSLLYGGETVLGRQLRLLRDYGISEFWISASGYEDEFKKVTADRDFEYCTFNWLEEVVYDRGTNLFSLDLGSEGEEIIVIPASLVFNRELLYRLLRGKASPLAVARDIKSAGTAPGTGMYEPVFAKVKGKVICDIKADGTGDSDDGGIDTADNSCEIMPFYRIQCGQSTLSGTRIIFSGRNDICTDNHGGKKQEFIEKLKERDCYEQPVKSEYYILYRIKELLEAQNAHKPIVVEDQNKSGSLVCGLLESWGYDYLKYKADSKQLTEELASKLADTVEGSSCDFVISIGCDYAIEQAKMACFLLNEKRDPSGRRTVRHLVVSDGSGRGCEVLPSVHIYNGDSYKLLEDNGLLPDNVYLEPKLADDLPEETKKQLFLSSVCECGDIYCAMLSPSYDQESIETILTYLLHHGLGFLLGSLTSTRCFMLNLLMERKLSYYCGETKAVSIAKHITGKYGIPYGYAIAHTAPVLWTCYADALPGRQVVGGKKSAAAMLDRLRCLFGANTNFEFIELFRYMLQVLHVKVTELEHIDLSGLHITNSNDPFTIDTADFETLSCNIAAMHKFCFEYPENSFIANGIWKSFIKVWRKDLANAELSRRRMLELGILDEAVRICTENDLRYFLTYGSLLGAIRHKGFIPWNDNIDIAMPRKDYDIFLRKAKEQLNSGLCIHNSDTDERCWFSHTRLIKKDTLLETVREMSFHSGFKGIGINIWPMDGVKSASGFLSKLRYRLIRGIDALIECRIAPGYRKMGWKGKLVLKWAGIAPTGKLRGLQKRLIEGKHKNDPPYYSLGQRYRFGREIIPANAFNGSETAEFEGRRYSIPAGWDKILSGIYGNYNILPPVKMQKQQVPVKVAYDGRENIIRFRILSETAANGSAGAASRQAFVKRLFKGIMKSIKKILGKPGKLMERAYVRITGYFRCRGLLLTENSRRLASYKGKYEGQRCFLIGNGPSLKSEDLDRLRNEVTFGCNLIYKIYDQTRWRPTFYCISDSGVTRTNSYGIAENMDGTTLMIREFAYRYMKVKPPAVCLPYISIEGYKVKGNMLAYHYISHSTVMSMLVELAIYMGFKEIYLIGVDGTGSSAKGSHFTDNYFSKEMKEYADNIKKKILKNYVPDAQAAKLQKRSMDTYGLLRKYAETHGIKILNATRGGVLEVFERADLDVLLQSGTAGNGENI